MPKTSDIQSFAAGDVEKASTVALFAFVVLAWGLSWVAMKIVVQEVTPLWAVAMRTGIAAIVLVPALISSGQLILPQRSDYPIILVIALFHMVAFAALMTAGLKYVTAGRAIVLGYTTPLWVAPAAWFFLKETMTPRQVAGIALGLAGLLYMFNPQTFDWHDTGALLGNGLVLLAAVCWSVSIVYIRMHRWTATPFQLALWQVLFATIVLSTLALIYEGTPKLALSHQALLALTYNGVIGIALGSWAMTVVNKRLPATSVALGLLCTPVIGIGVSTVVLGEALDFPLIASSMLILAGIAIGATSQKSVS